MTTHITTIGTAKEEKIFIEVIPLQDIKIAKITVIIVNILKFFIFGNNSSKKAFSAAVIHEAMIIHNSAISVFTTLKVKPSGENDNKSMYAKKSISEQ